MTVIELRDALNALIEQGHGGLKVMHHQDYDFELFEIDGPDLLTVKTETVVRLS